MGLDFHVIWENLTYFFIGRYPHGPLGGVALTFYLAVVSCILSFFGGRITSYNVCYTKLLRGKCSWS